LNAYGKQFQPHLMSDFGVRWHLPGVFARLGLLERIRLTPEGASFAELKRLTDTMIVAGKRLFVFSYHSPSVVSGATPYVRNESELQRFLALIDQFCEYFCGNCGGQGAAPHEVRAWYEGSRSRSGLSIKGQQTYAKDSPIAGHNV